MQIPVIKWVEIGIAVAGALVNAWTMRALSKNKLRSDFSTFFTYNGASIVANVIAIVPFIYWKVPYFYLYWTLNLVLMALEFGVLYEVLVHALKPYSALIDLGKMIFIWAAVFLLCAGLLTAVATGGTGGSRITAVSDLLGRSLRLMQCGLLLLFFSLEKRLGLSWRSYSMSIALGLGVYAAADLSFSYLAARQPAWSGGFDILSNSIYLLAAIFWTACLTRPEPSRKNVLDSPSKLIFQRWNEALATAGYGGSPSTVECFLPGIEKTVDRVMARRVS